MSVSVSASSTYASGSSHLLELPQPKQENKKKFVAARSYLPIDGSEASNVVKAISHALPALVASLKKIEDGIKWRQVTGLAASGAILKGIKDTLARMAGELFKEAGVQKTFPGIIEIEALAQVFLPSKAVEVDLIQAIKTAERLIKRVECQPFVKIYAYRAGVIDELVQLVLSNNPKKQQVLIERIQAICADLEKFEVPNQKGNKRAFKQIHLEVLDACLLSVHQLAPKANFALDPCIRDLEQRKANVQSAKYAARANEPPKNFAAPNNQLSRLKVDVDSTYDFSGFAHTNVWFAGLRGYAKTNDLGKFLEEIGKKIHMLETIVNSRLKGVLRGNVSPNIDDHVTFYTECYYELKTRLSTIFNPLNEKVFDGLTITALNYVSGIQTGLDAVRSSLITLRASIKQPQRQVLEALGELGAFYEGGHDVMQLYLVASKMQRCLPDKEVITKDALKPHGRYVERTFQLLQELHAIKDDELLDDATGIDILFSDEIDVDEVFTVLASRMQRYLFLPSKKHDIELELMLYAIRTLPGLKLLLDAMGRMTNFNEILKSYDQDAEPYRKERIKFYPIALEIMQFLILEEGVVGHAKGMRLIRDHFVTLPADIKDMLVAKLQAQAEVYGLPIVYPCIMEARTSLWDFSDTLAIDRQISHLSEAIRPISVAHSHPLQVWQALFFGLLAQSVYGKTTQDKVVVQKNIRAILQEIFYKRFLVVPNAHLEYLIRENAMRCVELSGAYEKAYQLTEFELALLQDGPFEKHFAGTLTAQDHARVGNVLRKCLMTPNAEALLATFKQKACFSETVFERMMQPL
ncbi:MAG: hypothetical protein LLF94_01710 [Chlamydiales bacterium]|nr:hypothetical protein [Chlamydiales bacterium]